MTVPARFLEGDQVYLRPFEASDIDWYFNGLYNSEMRRLTGTQKYYTREEVAQYIDYKGKDRSSVLLVIALRETDNPIGDIAISDIDSINRSAGLRIAVLSETYQGKGYGSEAIRLMLGYGFGILNLHRIELNVFDFNDRAAHVYRKLGFKQEGVQREALFYEHRYYNSILMAILEDEYRVRFQSHKGELGRAELI